MKVGILGTGFGSYHAKIYKKLDNIESIIVFGRDQEKLEKMKIELGIETTNDIRDIIANRDIDLVDICLPVPLHREYAIEALKNGKNVLCETPVCYSLEDANLMKAAEIKYGKRVFVDLFIKYEYPYSYLYETIRQNTLGKLKALHMKRESPHIWGDLSLHRITTNLMIHELDFVTWILGLPEEISAAGLNGEEGESHVDALLVYKDAIAEIQCSSMLHDHHPFTVGYEAIFEKGTIEYREDGYDNRCESSFMLYTNDLSKELEILNENCYENAIKHVLECCSKDLPTNLALEDAIGSINLALNIRERVLKTHTAQ